MNKDRIIELAKESEILRHVSIEMPFVIGRLERFAALIEAQVRGDAEPVAWLVRNGVVDYQLVKRKEQAEHLVVELQKRHNLSGSLASFNAVPLYTHPAPAVVRQLVEALAQLVGCIDYGNENPSLVIDKAKVALTAAKEAGL